MNENAYTITNLFSKKHISQLIFIFIAFAFSSLASADVIQSDESHFSLLFKVNVKSPIEKLDNTFSELKTWWHPDHTYTGDAKNLYFDFEKSHCLCESLEKGGFVSHMRIAYAEPKKMYRLLGGLGPLQSLPVNGVLEFRMSKKTDTETFLEVSYVVSGGFNMLKGWDKPVDQVIGAQVKRLVSEAEKD